jgi:hypothetical protein
LPACAPLFNPSTAPIAEFAESVPRFQQGHEQDVEKNHQLRLHIIQGDVEFLVLPLARPVRAPKPVDSARENQHPLLRIASAGNAERLPSTPRLWM